MNPTLELFEELFYMYKHICPKHTNLFPQLLTEDSAIQNLAEGLWGGKVGR